MEPLIGTYERTMDLKGRMNIPKGMRASSNGERNWVFLNENPELHVYPKSAYLKKTEQHMKKPGQDAGRREFFSATVCSTSDDLYRVVIPLEMRKDLGLEGRIELIISGNGDHLVVTKRQT